MYSDSFSISHIITVIHYSLENGRAELEYLSAVKFNYTIR